MAKKVLVGMAGGVDSAGLVHISGGGENTHQCCEH